MPKKIETYELLPLFRKFINELKKGKHLQKNGKRIKTGSIDNYVYLENLLREFSIQKGFAIRMKNVTGLTKKQFDDEKKYWQSFYLAFTNYLYDELKHYDNYVGRMIKLLRSFFNYLVNEKGLSVGFFHRRFYAPAEDVDIIVLSAERLNYLIYSEPFESSLSPDLKIVRDVFVFGCSVALRFSDLMALNKANLEIINDRMYIKMQSKKTQTYTRVKLPDFSVKIINNYSTCCKNKLLPGFTKAYLNKKVKLLSELAGFTEPIIRTRQRRGVPHIIYKDPVKKVSLRFCDAVTTHTMRRTAITTMISLGMNEQMVRQISGHTSNSKEFYRYVAFAQNYMDSEIDTVHKKLNEKKLAPAQ
ncbi:hypothetical protein CNR22_24305 [Sphingobacteriaceae bacterium]|nr:hypothetical protein CNR22_00065 [Sphingobacteriaceae bacterium]PBQ34764.1 hypothetical protein CNR22_24305 [Sphingobacteriaceae bacterium]